MVMIEEVHPPLDLTIWIRLADKTEVSAYPGFEDAPADRLPGEAGFLIGHIDEFEKLFRHILDEERPLRRNVPSSSLDQHGEDARISAAERGG